MENPTTPAGASTAALNGERLPDDWCLHHFDHLSEELAATMPATMARMRELSPVARSEEHGGFWVATGYEEALSVAQNWGTFSSEHGLSVAGRRGVVRNLPVEVDPPAQRAFKSLITPYFTPAAVAEYEPPTRELVVRLIEEFVADGQVEFMDGFARKLPSQAFFEFAIGAPLDELDEVSRLASLSSVPNHPDAAENWRGLYAWVKGFLDRRRASEPRGDVVDAVLAAEIDGVPLTDDEKIGAVQLLILGGLETTAGTLGLVLERFCREPHIPAMLRERPELMPKAVEEALRLDSAFVSVGRTAVREDVLGGHKIAAGDKLLIHWASANRDAGEFPDPHTFDPNRSRNRHFAFGAGPHRCAGSNLARLNIRVALEEIVARMDDIALAEGARIEYHAGLTRSPLSLPITFTPRTPN